MHENQAKAIAGTFGGESWQSGGDIWLVTIPRSDGRIVVVSDDAICLYADEGAFDRGETALQSIEFRPGVLTAER